ncbi:MAG: hypothetical protein IT531_19565 [Burkholderiales bacterium]|nr:hypothetical protein [Burkholderiales bacterium]
MRSTTLRKRCVPAATLELGRRLMLRCAGGYLLASIVAAAVGFAGMGRLSLSALVFALLLSALMLAAGLLCSALGALEFSESNAHAPARKRARG